MEKVWWKREREVQFNQATQLSRQSTKGFQQKKSSERGGKKEEGKKKKEKEKR